MKRIKGLPRGELLFLEGESFQNLDAIAKFLVLEPELLHGLYQDR